MKERICVASRGRNPNNPADRRKGIITEQRLELQTGEYSNSITTVQKDNQILESETMEDNAEYRIRRLTAKECWRLMGFSDRDYNAAAQANSNSQLYKQAGNSIVENVLIAIFGQMIPGKENVYRERERNSNSEIGGDNLNSDSIGYIEGNTGQHQSNKVHESKKLSPAIDTGSHVLKVLKEQEGEENGTC